MKSGLEILIVEDDADTVANLSDILELDGHRLHVARSFASALRVMSATDMDLMVLDRRMPDGMAESVLPELRERFPSTEIIVVTGYAEVDSTIAAFRLGVADYILKPVNPGAIRQCVSRIAHQRWTEARLQQECRFGDQLLATAEAIVLVLDLDGRVVRFNPYFTKIAGWRLVDLKGRDWFDYCTRPRDHRWLRRVFMETRHPDPRSGVVNAIVTSDGRERQIRWSNSALIDAHGTATAMLAIGLDVTDLINAQEVALRSERLAAIGQTITSLAHESRNSLQRIRASAEMLAVETEVGSDARDDIDAIIHASDDLYSLLEEVRSYAAPILLHREPATMQAIWRRAWEHLRDARRDRDAVLIEPLGGCDLLVDVDVLRMSQVFRNLFENALSACIDPVRIHVQCRLDRDTLVLDIYDNGPGFSQEQRDQIFDPFYTTKSHGTGLGLSIVQRIIEAHQGQIAASSSTESGAHFHICVPTSAAANLDQYAVKI